MKYTREPLQLHNPLEFWMNFPSAERVFWVDRQSDRVVVGAERLATVRDEEDRQNYEYVFYGDTFFETVRDEKWQGLGDEMVAFRHYYIVENGESFYLHAEEAKTIERFDIPDVRHDYHESSDDFEDWQQLFGAIQRDIKSGHVKKVVGSREVEFTCDTEFNVPSMLNKLVDNNPGCFIFAYEKDGRTFLGASPEILVRHRGKEILSYALAGTAPKEGEDRRTADELLHDPKNLFEHGIVTDAIVDNMKEITSKITVGETGIMELKHLYHLRTTITAEDDTLSLVEWGKRLHPTPAMGGEPRERALQILKDHERHERGMYAAPFGFMKDMGDGILVVGIRSALVIGPKLYAYAGCGIVEQSNVNEEYRETRNKMKTIVEAL